MSFLRLPLHGKQKRRQYDPKLLTLAYKDVVEKGISVCKAAKLFGVPESTLRDRTLGLQPDPKPTSAVFSTNPGPSPTFSTEEEHQLLDHVTYMASIGYGYSRKEFLTLSTDFAVSLNKKKTTDPLFAQSWFESFKKRNPELSLCKPQKLSVVRAKCTSESVLNNYFSALEDVMDTNDLSDKPEKIWNIDETGIVMEHNPTNVVCEKGTTPQAITSNRGKNVTIIASGNAVGTRIPPYYVFPGKRWNDELLAGSSPGSSGTMSDSGWSNSTVFMTYLEEHFLKHVSTTGSPLLILFDGHKSHVNLTLTEWGKSHNIIFYVLPPHTSHVTQPLDVGCFGPLKNAYYSECQAFLRKTPGITINRYNVASISSKAYNKALTPDNLISSFRKTGIYPLERKQISTIKTAPSTIYQQDEEDTLLAESQSTLKNNSFLDDKKITKVSEFPKKRKSHPSVTGNLMSPSKSHILKKIKTVSVTPAKSQKNVNTALSSKPSASKVLSCPVPPLSVEDSDVSDSILADSQESVCCVCNKFRPDALNLDYVLEFVLWGQCDKCGHWTHLKFCTKVKCLRRDSTFLCPHCN